MIFLRQTFFKYDFKPFLILNKKMKKLSLRVLVLVGFERCEVLTWGGVKKDFQNCVVKLNSEGQRDSRKYTLSRSGYKTSKISLRNSWESPWCFWLIIKEIQQSCWIGPLLLGALWGALCFGAQLVKATKALDYAVLFTTSGQNISAPE